MDFKVAAAKEAREVINSDENKRIAILKEALEVHRQASRIYREIFIRCEENLAASKSTKSNALKDFYIKRVIHDQEEMLLVQNLIETACSMYTKYPGAKEQNQ